MSGAKKIWIDDYSVAGHFRNPPNALRERLDVHTRTLFDYLKSEIQSLDYETGIRCIVSLVDHDAPSTETLLAQKIRELDAALAEAQKLKAALGGRKTLIRNLRCSHFRNPLLVILYLAETSHENRDEAGRITLRTTRTQICKILDFEGKEWLSPRCRPFEPRWVNLMASERSTMAKQGLVINDKFGWWGLTDAGRRDAKNILNTAEGKNYSLLLRG